MSVLPSADQARTLTSANEQRTNLPFYTTCLNHISAAISLGTYQTKCDSRLNFGERLNLITHGYDVTSAGQFTGRDYETWYDISWRKS